LGLAASHPAAWSLPPPPILPPHFEGPITDPPPAYSEGQRKLVPPPPPLLDSSSADSRRGGLLNALLDKVRPRDEGNNTIGGNGGGRRSQTTECLAFGLRGDEGRWPQPLLENLDCTGTLRGLTGSRDDMKKGPSPNGGAAEYGQPVQKPYEPPVLGKSSRITPVGQFLLFIYIRTRKILLDTSQQYKSFSRFFNIDKTPYFMIQYLSSELLIDWPFPFLSLSINTYSTFCRLVKFYMYCILTFLNLLYIILCCSAYQTRQLKSKRVCCRNNSLLIG
jgi:hypothetical protein